MAIRVDISGDGIWDKELNDPDVVLPEITDETGDGLKDVNLTVALSSAIINGAIFSDAANTGSGTGGYNTFLAIQDQTGGENPQDSYEQGFNSDDKNPLDGSNDEIDPSKTQTVLLGAVPIRIINGIAYFEFRVDLNESNSAPDTNISLDQFRLYTSTNGAIESTLDLFDTTAGDGDPAVTSLRYDMDAGHDVSVLLSEANSSGSGTDDYAVLVPVSNFAGVDPATTYLYLWVQMGAADGPADGPSNSWITNGGFEEWNLQNAVIIQGTKFNDINGDGDQDAGEGGVAGVTIFIDNNLDGIDDPTDNNGILDVDAGEQFDITDANGNYSFGGIPLGDADYTIHINEVVPAGSEPTTDLPVEVVIDSSFAAGTIINTTSVPGLLIGNRLLTPSISITKSASVPGDCANVVGELITYTIVVDNDGDLTLTSVVLTDNFEGAGNVTITPLPDDGDGILEVGEVWLSGDTNGNSQMETTETWTYTYVRAVTQAQIDSNGGGNGTLTDVATVNATSANGSVTDNDDATIPICQEPALSIVKTASVPGDCANVVGELISYSIVLDNIGNVALDNVVLQDNFEGGGNVTLTAFDDGDGILEVGEVFVSGDVGNDGIMGVDETWTYTYLRAVTQAMIDSNGGGDGTLDNLATANATAVNSDEAADEVTDDASVDVCQEPALSIVKTASVPGDCANVVGELISYSIVLDNIGNVALDNVVLQDNFEGGGNVTLTAFDDGDGILEVGEVFVSGDVGNDGIMGVDETWTYTYLRAVTQAMIDSNGGGDGTLDNLATANATAVNSDEAADEVTDDASVDVCQEPALSIVKTASVPGDCANVVGELISYSIVLDNIGNVALDNVVLQDNFEGGGNVTLTAFDDGDGILEVGEVFVSGDVGNDGIMGVDETWTYTYLRAVTQAMIDSNGGGDGTLDNLATANATAVNSDEAADEVTDDASVDVCQEPALSIVKTASVPGDCANVVGELISYSIVLDNIGNVALDNVVLQDNFEGGGNVTLTAFDDGDGILEVGEVFVSGDVGNDGIMGVDETWTYTYLRAVTQAMIDSNGGGDGTLDNLATANATAVNSDEAADEVTDDASVDVCQEPALSIVKTASVPGDCANVVGELISYSIVLDNIGNVALDNVVLQDNFEGGGNVTLTAFDDGDGILEVGEVFVSGDVGNDGIMGVDETWTYTYLRAVTQAMIDSNGGGDGTLDNLATANATAVNSDEAADEVTDDASVDVCQEPAITIEKSVKTNLNNVYADADDPDGLEASTSSTVDFRIVLTNTGNVTLTAITLSDSVVHTVNGIPQAAVPIDYSDLSLNAFIDLDGDAILDAGEEWANFDTNGDGTLDVDENGDPFELSVGETLSIYYSLDSQLGQHENTATVAAFAATTLEEVGGSDDANYYVLGSDDCVGVGTPGFWGHNGFSFWDGIALNEKHTGDPNVDGDSEPGFADGELLYAVDSNENGIAGGAGDVKGLLIGDYNTNGITDAGEDTIFISLGDARKLIDASNRQLTGNQADGVWMLGRDVVATWLNYLANGGAEGDCIGDAADANSPTAFLNGAIDWLQQFASDQNSNAANNLINTYHDGDTQALFQFDGKIATNSSVAWQNPFTPGENIPYSGSAMHSALDAYNNSGVINGIEYCCDRDNPLALLALQQLHSDYIF